MARGKKRHLFFASHVPVASKIVKEIMDKYRDRMV